MSMVGYITWNNKPLAYIVRAEISPEQTTFLTPPDFNLKLGFLGSGSYQGKMLKFDNGYYYSSMSALPQRATGA